MRHYSKKQAAQVLSQTAAGQRAYEDQMAPDAPRWRDLSVAERKEWISRALREET